MHPHLLRALDLTVAHFQADPRCLGMYLHGSIGRGETDAYSDIDVCAVIADEHYEAAKSQMRARCEELFGPITIWLPEGERPGYCNYAFLFAHGEELLLTDFDIVSRGLFVEWGHRPDRILWDREGLLGQVGAAAKSLPAVSDHRVLHLIDTYWVYAYLDGKYWRRADQYKLLYVQQTLFQLHAKLLQVLHCGAEGTWWAGDIARLPVREQRALRAYFTAATPRAVRCSLTRGLDLFAAAARGLCAARGLAYPAEREQAVRQHLQQTVFGRAIGT